jgi:hypothetical protein
MIGQINKPPRQVDSVVRSGRAYSAQRSRWDRTRLQPRRTKWQRCGAALRRHTHFKNPRSNCTPRPNAVKLTIEWRDNHDIEAALPELYVAFDEEMTIESHRSCPAENLVDVHLMTLCSRKRRSIDRMRISQPMRVIRRVESSAARMHLVRAKSCKRCQTT